MTQSAYTVAGMTCEHCAAAVSREIATLPGVTDIDVDVTSGRLAITSDRPLDDTMVQAAVEGAGYTVAERDGSPDERGAP